MKKALSIILGMLIMLGPTALCETLTIDLSTASVDELEGLKQKIEDRITQVKEEELALCMEVADIEALFADTSSMQWVRFPSKITQVAQGIGSVQFLTSWNGYDEYPFIVNYTASNDMQNLTAGDAVMVYGEVSGLMPVNGVGAVAIKASIIESMPYSQLAAIQEKATEGYEIFGDFSAKPYQWSTRYSNYAGLVVKNGSPTDQELTVNFIFRDADGNMVGVAERTINALDSEQTSIVVASNDTTFATFDYKISGSSSRYKGINAGLQAEVVKSGEKIIVSLSNNGSIAARFVEGHALFFKEGQVVYHNTTYFTGADSEIKPAETIMRELEAYETFDAYEVYFEGYGKK